MKATDFLSTFLSQTARICLAKHCQGSEILVSEMRPRSLAGDRPEDRVSRIVLSSSTVKIVLKLHFDIEMAIAFASIGLEREENEIDDSLAVDFMREFSNLHAGYLRGLLEKVGITAGFSLPFVIAETVGSSVDNASEKSKSFYAWSLQNESSRLLCTAEAEFVDAVKYLDIIPRLQNLLNEEMTKSTLGDGSVEFF